MPAELDAIDMKILELMQRDASLSTAELAERVGLSQSPCWRRIQRMREEGYIKAQVVIVDREKLGFKMQIFAQVKMTTLSEEDRAKFHKSINDIPEIL
jgi:Lrp/AsnC family transcriptional regulator